MTLKVFWSDRALVDAQKIFAYIAQDNIKNAHLVADRIDNTISLLAVTPFGRAGRMRGTYEAVVPKTPFIVAYTLKAGASLSIARIIHGARDWRGGKWPD
jgi:toxin ParE1/3/4